MRITDVRIAVGSARVKGDVYIAGWKKTSL